MKRTTKRIGAFALTIVALAGLAACGFPAPDTPLGKAAQAGNVAEVKALLARGENPNTLDKGGMTPLIRAARQGDVAVVRALLEGHADPNLKDAPVTRPGWTPLMNAVHKNQLAVVRVLIDSGADVNAAASNGTTALMLAAGDSQKDIVRALLGAGANAKPGAGGSAALTNAVIAGKGENAEILIAYDPSLQLESDLRARFGVMASKMAGHADILGRIEGARTRAREGAKPPGFGRASTHTVGASHRS